MYLIDTDVFIWILRNKPEYVKLIENLQQQAPVSLSVMTIAEVYKSFFPSELVVTEQWLREYRSWDVTATIARRAGFYWQQYVKRLKNLHIVDCIIASTAREHDLTLVTLNARHFPMGDIRLYRDKH